MYSISWLYLYVGGGLCFVGGMWLVWRAGVLDFRDPRERRAGLMVAGCFVLFAAAHAVLQFVLPFVG